MFSAPFAVVAWACVGLPLLMRVFRDVVDRRIPFAVAGVLIGATGLAGLAMPVCTIIGWVRLASGRASGRIVRIADWALIVLLTMGTAYVFLTAVRLLFQLLVM